MPAARSWEMGQGSNINDNDSSSNDSINDNINNNDSSNNRNSWLRDQVAVNETVSILELERAFIFSSPSWAHAHYIEPEPSLSFYK